MIPDLTTVTLLLPELILIAMATFIFVVGAFRPHATWWPVFASLTFVGTLCVSLFELWQHLADTPMFLSGPLVIDYLGQLLRPLAMLLGLLFTVMMSRVRTRELTSEFMGTLMLTIVGVLIVARANDLVLLFLGLELVSIPTYILLFLGRRDRAAGEATIKYFFLSILSSALLLYGLSFLYGMGGTTALTGTSDAPGIREVLEGLKQTGGTSANVLTLAPLAVVLILAGLGFKIAAVPFHFYAPDVYQGTTPGNAALLAVVPKIAGVAALIRVLFILNEVSPLTWQLVLIISLLTMTLGNICALWQKNIRRLLGFSSIAHSGYLLIGLAVALAADAPAVKTGGLGATLFYLAAYSLGSIAAFAALTYLGDDERVIDGVDELAGAGKSHPLAAGVLAVAMFSFAGIPIFAGFWGKFTLFTSTIELATGTASRGMSMWFMTLAIVGALNAAIGAAYYLRVVGAMFFQPEARPAPGKGGTGAFAAMVAAGVLVLAIGAMPRTALQGAALAGQALRFRAATAPSAKSAASVDTPTDNPTLVDAGSHGDRAELDSAGAGS